VGGGGGHFQHSLQPFAGELFLLQANMVGDIPDGADDKIRLSFLMLELDYQLRDALIADGILIALQGMMGSPFIIVTAKRVRLFPEQLRRCENRQFYFASQLFYCVEDVR
jgi:hypothetical protein